jgi:hypothetical protein
MRVVALIGGDMKATATTLVALALAISLPAHAQVFRCVDGEGHTVFSDTDCGTRAEKVEVVQSSGGLSAITSDGLSPQEKSALGAAEARAAAQAGSPPTSSGSSAAAPAASSPEPAHRSY